MDDMVERRHDLARFAASVRTTSTVVDTCTYKYMPSIPGREQLHGTVSAQQREAPPRYY